MPINDLANTIFENHPFVFRNNVGLGYAGGKERIDASSKLIVSGCRKIRFGLDVGSHDYIGWTETIITADMIGQKVAVFTSIEAKTLCDNLSAKQHNWFRRVKEAGGIAIVYKETKDGIRRIDEV